MRRSEYEASIIYGAIVKKKKSRKPETNSVLASWSGRQQGDGLPFRAARSPYSVSGRHGGQNLYYSLHKLTQHWIRSKVDDMDVKIRVPYLSRNTINGASLEEQGSA